MPLRLIAVTKGESLKDQVDTSDLGQSPRGADLSLYHSIRLYKTVWETFSRGLTGGSSQIVGPVIEVGQVTSCNRRRSAGPIAIYLPMLFVHCMLTHKAVS